MLLNNYLPVDLVLILIHIMENVVQIVIFILCTSAALLLLMLMFINVYSKIRRRFPVKVNCWFCNQWTKVHYDDWNNFECPTCLQYNGFTLSGDYNKPIPAQQDELLNLQLSTAKNPNLLYRYTNGLCHICNNNQQLKVYQLANFIPFNEFNFDAEIEHFQKQLEKAYKLCSKCDSIVKSTIRKQNCLLGLTFSELRRKGLLLMDLNRSHDGISKETKQVFIRKCVNFVLIVFACLNLLLVLTQLDLSSKNLKTYVPTVCLNHITAMETTWKGTYQGISAQVADYVDNVKETIASSVLDLPYLMNVTLYLNDILEADVFRCAISKMRDFIPLALYGNGTLVCFVGALLQLASMVLWKNKNSIQLCGTWNVLFLLRWFYSTSGQILTIAHLVQIIGSIMIIGFTYQDRDYATVKLKKLKRSKEHPWEMKDPDEEELSFELKSNTARSNPNHFKKNFESHAFNDLNSSFTARRSLSHQSSNSISNKSSPLHNLNTASIFNASLTNHSSPKKTTADVDLDLSLNKLHLGSSNVQKSPTANVFYTNPNVARPKPIISPSKLRNVAQNSWVAGGFWKPNDSFYKPNSVYWGDMSRSSSQTSGFASQSGPEQPNYISSLPTSTNNSFCGEFECGSVLSEPVYCTNKANASPPQNSNCGQYFTRLPTYPTALRPLGTFYPVLNHEQLVYFSPSCVHSYSFSQQDPANMGQAGFNFGSNLDRSSTFRTGYYKND